MIIKILCFLGFHEWGKTEYQNIRKCWHCGFKEVIYDDDDY